MMLHAVDTENGTSQASSLYCFWIQKEPQADFRLIAI
jgi:hypothetical protein